jgi:spore germination cell wall hydrolase CwlJ-like protein
MQSPRIQAQSDRRLPPLLIEDVLIAARTVWGEARGEPYLGKLAVAHVLLNRWRVTTGQFARDDTLATACLRHRQFSAWNAGDPNFTKLFDAGLDDASFRASLRAVIEALDTPDMTHGARHYHTRAVTPAWASGHTPSYQTGNHLFYNDVE